VSVGERESLERDANLTSDLCCAASRLPRRVAANARQAAWETARPPQL